MRPLNALVWLGCGLIAIHTFEARGLEQVEVFKSGKDGYHTYRIPAVVVATNRTVLAFCEGRKDSARDTGRIDLVLKQSFDGGRTWGPQRVLWSDSTNVCGNPTVLVDRITGTIWLLATWNLAADTEQKIADGSSQDTRRVFELHSADNGLTWSTPRELTSAVKKPTWRWYATGPGNAIQLTRGAHARRLLVPANHTEMNPQGRSISCSHVIFSDDHGRTWQIGGIEDEQTNESTLVELADGSVIQNMRSYAGKHLRAIGVSHDGGLGWTHIRLDPALPEPVCQGSLLRWTWPDGTQKNRILFSNPASTKRENLTVRLSYDEGVSWPSAKVLSAAPAAYSCLTALLDGMIGCLYECGSKTPYERIVLARLTLRDFEP
jgi:sialidase-1